jgi:hypothetical protein
MTDKKPPQRMQHEHNGYEHWARDAIPSISLFSLQKSVAAKRCLVKILHSCKNATNISILE